MSAIPLIRPNQLYFIRSRSRPHVTAANPATVLTITVTIPATIPATILTAVLTVQVPTPQKIVSKKSGCFS